MADVFISYARSDHAKAAQFRALLDREGLSVFFDVDGIDGGQVFPDVLDRELKTAGCVLGLWTPHALTRPWVKIECQIGKDRDVLVAAAVSPLNPTLDIPAALYGVHYVDLSDFGGDPSDSRWRRVLDTIARKSGKTVLEPGSRPPSKQPADALQPSNIDVVTNLLRQGLSAKWSIAEAILCLLLATVLIDEGVSMEEHDSMLAVVGKSRTLRSLSPQQLDTIRMSVEARYKSDPNALKEACQSLPRELRLAALANVVDVLLADSALTELKSRFLGDLIHLLEVPANEAKQIVEVMLLRDKI